MLLEATTFICQSPRTSSLFLRFTVTVNVVHRAMHDSLAALQQLLES